MKEFSRSLTFQTNHAVVPGINPTETEEMPEKDDEQPIGLEECSAMNERIGSPLKVVMTSGSLSSKWRTRSEVDTEDREAIPITSPVRLEIT